MKKKNLTKADIKFFRIMNVVIPFMWGMWLTFIIVLLWDVLQ